MLKKVLQIIVVSLFIISCSDKEESKNIAFYHWKAKADYNKTYERALHTAKTKTIYIHYFDLKLLNKNDWKNDGIYPVYLLRDVDKTYRDFEIIPVVYITNHVFKNKIDIEGLVQRTTKLINQISEKQFQKTISKIQIDCDWTQSTKHAYFEFLKLLSNKFEISTTIRLHQIKFKNKTGVPPVKSGTLMLYNIGDLKNKQQNSILENNIVKQYINTETNYPLQLNLGLPLFSQTIVTNKANKIKIIKDTERTVLENDIHFKKINKMNFSIIKDTLYKGFYLTKGYTLKLEELTEDEIISSYKTLKNSKLTINGIIFYHLDENALKSLNLNKIISEL